MEQPNTDYIDKLSGDNLEFRNRMIEILKRELPEEIEVYQNLIKSKNYLLTSQSVHKLKHKISILGLEKSYYLAEKFEDNLKNQSVLLQTDFENVLKLINEFVNNL